MSEWGKTIGTVLGGALAGPSGALIGGIIGSTIDSVTPGAQDITANMIAGFGTDSLKKLIQYGRQRFQTPKSIQVNRDLQNAFRDALRTAIHDIGGRECFAQAWSQPRRICPDDVVYPLAALGLRDRVLADQICACLNEFSIAVDELLLLTSPSTDPTVINSYILGGSTKDLELAFWQEVTQPFLAHHPVAPEVSTAFESHLHRYLLPRTLVHLGENLKQRPDAWRMFNRLLLETIQHALTEAASNDDIIIQDLAAIRAQVANLILPDSEQLASLITELGETRRHQAERFDHLLNRVMRQHRELLSAISGVHESVIHAERRLSQKITELSTIQVTSSEIQDLPPFSGEPPYKGLLAYEQEDEAIYFGRSELASKLAQTLRNRSFVAMVGRSGSGKSSLVSAGMLPILARQGWRIFKMTPTTQPLDKLAQTLYPQNNVQRQRFRREVSEDAYTLVNAGARLAAATSVRRVVLVVDQFEELFTQAQNEAANHAFVAALLAVRSNGTVSVLIVLRSDFYQRCAEYEGLFSAVAESQIALESLSTRQLLDVIGQPLVRNHWRIQEGLAQTIIEDVGREAGGLPFLAHALRETWERRRHNVLTLSGYQEAGGVKGAITASAEAAWLDFNPQEQIAARTILTELTELGEREDDKLHTPDTRRRCTYSELAQLAIVPATLDTVLEEFVRRRLLTRDHEHIEVAHEALIRAWPRLQQWLNADHVRLEMKRQFEAEADTWEKHHRDPSYLARGTKLALMSEWATFQSQFPTGKISEFLQASIAIEEFEHSRELEQAQNLAAAQTRRALTFRWAAVVTATLLVVAIVTAAWAVSRQQLAEENAAKAQSRLLAAVSQNEAIRNPMRSWILAIQAGRMAETDQAFAVINEHMFEMAQPLAALGHYTNFISASWSDDGSRILSRDNSTIHIWDVQSGASLLTLAHNATIRGASWNKDESRILSWGHDNTVHLWDAKEGTSLLTLAHNATVSNASWNKDESRILSISEDNVVRIWDAESGVLLLKIPYDSRIDGALWNADESRILSWSLKNVVQIWDAESGALLLELPHEEHIVGASWNEDESRILSWGYEDVIHIWDAKSGVLLLNLAPNRSLQGITYYEASWNADESRILSWGYGTVDIWDAKSGALLLTLAHDYRVLNASWSNDESRILSVSEDNIIHIWDAQSGISFLSNPNGYPIRGNLWNADESRILSWDYGSVDIWDAKSGALLLTLAHDSSVYGAIWNADESRILSWGYDNIIHLWDAKSGTSLLTLVPDNASYVSSVNGALWNADESRILSWGYYGVQIWDAKSGALLLTLAHDSSVYGASWNQDESRILSWGYDDGIRILDAQSGASILILDHTNSIEGASWNQDESRILSWGYGSVGIWDAQSGASILILDHTNSIEGASWNKDESRILSWGYKAVQIWDAKSGVLLLTLAHDNSIKSALWDDNESRILSISEDNVIRLWDAQSGEYLRTISDSNFDITNVQWSRIEEQSLVTTSDGHIYRYYNYMPELLDVACTRVTRNLTRAEWQQYLSGAPYSQTCPTLPVTPVYP